MSARTLHPPHRPALVPLLGLVIGLLSCDSSLATAPSGSQITSGVSRSPILPNGDTTAISVFVSDPQGRPVSDNTAVTLLVSNATICDQRRTSVFHASDRCDPQNSADWSTALTVGTRRGIVAAAVKSGAALSNIKVAVRSGAVTHDIDIPVTTLILPSDGKLLLASEQDTVSPGTEITLHIYAATGQNQLVPDGTRILASASKGIVSPRIVITYGGHARIMYRAGASGLDTVTAESGSVRTTAIITVR